MIYISLSWEPWRCRSDPIVLLLLRLGKFEVGDSNIWIETWFVAYKTRRVTRLIWLRFNIIRYSNSLTTFWFVAYATRRVTPLIIRRFKVHGTAGLYQNLDRSPTVVLSLILIEVSPALMPPRCSFMDRHMLMWLCRFWKLSIYSREWLFGDLFRCKDLVVKYDLLMIQESPWP